MLHLHRTLLAIWVPTSVALLVVACGGSSSDNSGGVGTLGGSTGNTGGSTSATGGAGTVGGNAGTTAAAGSSAVAGTSSSGGSTGNGGSASSGGSTSSGGDAGMGGKAACAALIDAANQALAAAQTCDPKLNANTCTGSVRGICGCMVAAQPNDSAATKAYLAALMTVQSNKCMQLCPAIACIAPGPGLCVQQAGSSMGMCTNGRLAAQ